MQYFPPIKKVIAECKPCYKLLRKSSHNSLVSKLSLGHAKVYMYHFGDSWPPETDMGRHCRPNKIVGKLVQNSVIDSDPKPNYIPIFGLKI